ncbi:MAG TPA: hypothetical protein VJP78_04000 [Thermoleophilia bacterium]|nr:hypothetical protein [Thermoleophilia bacterium]
MPNSAGAAHAADSRRNTASNARRAARGVESGGADFTRRFKSTSGGHETVTLPLRAATRTLVRSAEGTDERPRVVAHGPIGARETMSG